MNPTNNSITHENEYFKLRMKELMGPDWKPTDLPEMSTVSDWHPGSNPPPWTSPITTPYDSSRHLERNHQRMIVEQTICDLVKKYGVDELPKILDFMKFLMEETELGEQYRIHLAELVLRGEGDPDVDHS
jgi:hypothetical protein